jgi:hypothetical protein
MGFLYELNEIIHKNIYNQVTSSGKWPITAVHSSAILSCFTITQMNEVLQFSYYSNSVRYKTKAVALPLKVSI